MCAASPPRPPEPLPQEADFGRGERSRLPHDCLSDHAVEFLDPRDRDFEPSALRAAAHLDTDERDVRQADAVYRKFSRAVAVAAPALVARHCFSLHAVTITSFASERNATTTQMRWVALGTARFPFRIPPVQPSRPEECSRSPPS